MRETRPVRLSVLIALGFAAATSAETGPTAEPGNPCAFDRSEMLSLDQNTFDQDVNSGWRQVANHSECRAAAADLIRDYVNHHDLQKPILIFHEGQLRAMAGQTVHAIELIEKTRKPEGQADRIGWNSYVDATVAFLRKDERALASARKSLANTPKPDNFNPVDTNGNLVKVIWPPNLNVVDGFVRCFEEIYDFAYNNCSGPFSKRE